MIYLDNAATTGYKPPQVINAVADALQNLSANPGRSGHKLSTKAMMTTMQTRQSVCDFVNGYSPDKVIFCQNCTSALNLAILGSATKGCHVISSFCEHNSILRPLFELQRRKIIDLTMLVPDGNHKISPADVQSAIRKNTTMIVLGHISNVTASIQNITEIGKIAKKHNILFVVDGAQSVGYTQIDMQKQNIDMLAFPAHKGLHGPMGLGCLCFGDKAPKPIVYGGTGTDSHMLLQPTTTPEGFESGTQNLPAISGLYSAIEWHKSVDVIDSQKRKVFAKMIFDGLKLIKGVSVISSPDFESGIISFAIDNVDSLFASDLLDDKFDIATRAGLHCAPLIHKHLGTDKTGLVRASVSAQNTKDEVYAFLNAVEQIAKQNF